MKYLNMKDLYLFFHTYSFRFLSGDQIKIIKDRDAMIVIIGSNYITKKWNQIVFYKDQNNEPIRCTNKKNEVKFQENSRNLLRQRHKICFHYFWISFY